MTKIQNAWLGGLTVLCFIIIYLHFSPSKKMVYVDTAQLLQEYVGMQQAKAAFQVKSKVWQANVDTLMSEVQKSIKDDYHSFAEVICNAGID